MKKKAFKKWGMLVVFATGSYVHLFAQNTPVIDSTILDRLSTLEQKVNDTRPGEDHFMVAGLATFGFVTNKTTNNLNGITTISKTNSLGYANNFEFSPLLCKIKSNACLIKMDKICFATSMFSVQL